MEPDQELDRVRRSQAGDRAAFEELVRAYARLLWAHVYGMVRDPAWTEDVVQETFLKAWGSLRELTEPGAFRGWIFTIARRLAWRTSEVTGRLTPLPEEAPEAAAPPEPEDPEEARERVQEALARLPERYRLPVTLHFLNGLEYEAISRLLNMPNGSLRGLIARGTQKLRAELAPWWRTQHEGA